MTTRLAREQVAEKAVVTDFPRVSTTVNRTFELPVGLYGWTVASYLGFLALMAAAFGNPAIAIPMAIFVISIVMGFGVPAVWVGLRPENRDRALDWGRFSSKGVQTFTGLVTSRDAAAQVLILPLLIVGWGLAVVIIASIVR